MAEPFQFDWTTAVPVDDEPQPSAPSTPTPPESVDAVMSATPFGAQNMPRPQQGPVDAYEEFDWKTAEPLDGGFDPSTAREATPAEDAEFYEQINSTAYLPTKDEWRWRENFRKQRDDKVSRFIEGGKAMAGGLIQAAAATAFAPFDFLRRGTVAYDEWVNSSAEGVRQTGIATAELWSWAGDVISDRNKEIERNAALDAKLRQQLASESRFTGNAETDGQVFLQAREAAMASGFYDKTPEELAEDEDTQYQRFIRDRSFQQQAENVTETNIGTLPDGRAEMGIDESKLNPGLVTTTQLIADPLNIAAGGLGVFSKVRPLRRAAALAGKPLELGGKAAGAAAQKADELYAGVVERLQGATGLTEAQQVSALQNPITWRAAMAMGTLKGAGGILRTGQTWMDTGSVFVREAGTGGVGVARVEAAGKLRTAPIPERYRRAYDGFFTSADSTLRRVSETPGLSPIARRSAATLDRVGATQAFRVADDAIGGALATTPIAVPLAAISPEERQPEMLGALMTVGAVGGVVGGKVRRVAESDDALVAKMLADVEISGGDATSMANMLSHDKLLRMAQMQTVMSAKADFVPLRANDYELNPTVNEHMGKNSRGFYVDATKGQRPRVFVNLDKLATGDVVGHEIGHAILKSDILGGQIKQGMRSVVDAQYGADGIAARGREYVKAQLTQEVNHRATGIEIEVLTPDESQRRAAGASMDELVADRWKNDPTWREQQINERVDLLNQEALGKGELSFDWARDEIVAETFSGLGKGINVAGLRASGPMGRTLGAMQTAMETMGARFTGNGRLESPNRLFTENPLFDTPQMRKAVNNYVKLYDRYLVGLEKEGKVKQRGRPIAPTGRPEEAARSPHTRTYDNNGVLESELFIERPDGVRVPKSQEMINTQEKARAATLKSINNRTRFVDENSSEWGARRLSNGRVEVGGPNLPPQFDYFVQVPQWLRDKAREFEAERAKGRSYLYSYNAIGTGEAGSYKIKNLGNVEAKTGEMVPFGWSMSKANHLLTKVIDLNSFRAAAMRAIDKGQLGEFGNNLRTVEADLKQLMRNYEEGRPGETGLGVTKKNILNGLLGTGTPTNRASNPVWHTLNNQGSIRTFRFDRLNYADQFDTGYFPHYQKININALPDDAGRMSLDDWMRFDADRQGAWLNKRARERGYTNSTNWANSDEAGFAAASNEYRKLLPRPDNNNRMPSALPQSGMAMPDGPVVRGRAMPDVTITPDEASAKGLAGPYYHGSPDFKGRKFTREHLGRNTGLSRSGISFTDDVSAANAYALEPMDPAQAAVDAANDVMREVAEEMRKGLKVKDPVTEGRMLEDASELPEFNVRYIDDMDEFVAYADYIADSLPAKLRDKLKAAARTANERPNPVVAEVYLRNPSEMTDVNGKKLWLVENPDDIFVSAARPPQGAATGGTRGQAMPDAPANLSTDPTAPKDVYARSIEDIKAVIPPGQRFVGNKSQGAPMLAPDGRPYLQHDLSKPTGNLFIKQADLDRAWREAVAETGPAAQRALDEMRARGFNMVPPNEAHWRAVGNLPLMDRFWYETSAEAMVISFPGMAQRGQSPKVMDTVAATSPLADPNYNAKLAISFLSEDFRQSPAQTPAVVPKGVSDALLGTFGREEQRKIGSFGGTFRFLAGLSDDPPLTTNDRQVASSFGVPDKVFGEFPVMYEAVSRFYNKLRDTINAGPADKSMGLFEAHQLQALSWVQHRAELEMARNKNVSAAQAFDGDAYAVAFKRAADELRAEGIAVASDPGTGLPIFDDDVLSNPRVTEILAPTSSEFMRDTFQTMEIVTKLTKAGDEFLRNYEESKALSIKGNIKDAETVIARHMNALTKRKDLGNGKKAPSLVTDLARVFDEKAEITRIEAGFGTFKGDFGQNLRIPLGSVPEQYRPAFLAILGKYYRQEAQAASRFVSSELGQTPTSYSVFFRGRVDTDFLGVLAKDLSAAGHEANVSIRPNGVVVDVMPQFGESGPVPINPIRLKQMADAAAGDTTTASVIDRDFSSIYLERQGYANEINKGKKGLLNDTAREIQEITGASRAAARDFASGAGPELSGNKAVNRRAAKARDRYRQRLSRLESVEARLRQLAEEFQKDMAKANRVMRPKLERRKKAASKPAQPAPAGLDDL